jgi:hypothetical protein
MTMEEHIALIPAQTLQGIRLYVEKRIPPGLWPETVLSNDLRGAFGHASDSNRDALWHIVAYLHWEIPARCWGSREAVRRWLAGGDHDQAA